MYLTTAGGEEDLHQHPQTTPYVHILQNMQTQLQAKSPAVLTATRGLSVAVSQQPLGHVSETVQALRDLSSELKAPCISFQV